MSLGLIATAMAGGLAGLGAGVAKGAEAYGDYLSRSALIEEQANVQRLRDERLAELETRRETDKEGRAKAERLEVGEAITRAETARVDDLSGSIREQTPSEQLESRRKVYAGRGLIDQEMKSKERIRPDEDARQRALDRSSDNQRADRHLDEQIRHDKATEAAQAATNARLMALTKVQTDAATFDLESKKELRKMQDAFSAETDPVKRATIERNILTRLGKAKELPEGVKAAVLTIRDELKVYAKTEADGMPLPPAVEQRRADLHRRIENLIATGTLGETPKAGGAKWNDATGEVLLDGKKIGTAKSADEARKILTQARTRSADKPKETTKPEDLGYDAANPTQFKHVTENMSQPSMRAQAQAWLDGNNLDAQQRKRVKILLGQQ